MSIIEREVCSRRLHSIAQHNSQTLTDERKAARKLRAAAQREERGNDAANPLKDERSAKGHKRRKHWDDKIREQHEQIALRRGRC